MGTQIFDGYTLSHVAFGILFYYFGVTFANSLLLHIMFELFENSKFGMYVMHNYITIWPGGKTSADSSINAISDTIYFAIGWIMAYYFNLLCKKYLPNIGKSYRVNTFY